MDNRNIVGCLDPYLLCSRQPCTLSIYNITYANIPKLDTRVLLMSSAGGFNIRTEHIRPQCLISSTFLKKGTDFIEEPDEYRNSCYLPCRCDIFILVWSFSLSSALRAGPKPTSISCGSFLSLEALITETVLLLLFY